MESEAAKEGKNICHFQPRAPPWHAFTAIYESSKKDNQLFMAVWLAKFCVQNWMRTSLRRSLHLRNLSRYASLYRELWLIFIYFHRAVESHCWKDIKRLSGLSLHFGSNSTKHLHHLCLHFFFLLNMYLEKVLTIVCYLNE